MKEKAEGAEAQNTEMNETPANPEAADETVSEQPVGDPPAGDEAPVEPEVPANPDVNDQGADAASQEISNLANFIMVHVEGEPSRSESAVDCAIRIMTNLQDELKDVHAALDDMTAQRDALQLSLDSMLKPGGGVTVHPDDTQPKRPRVGKELKLGEPVAFEKVEKAIADNRLFQVALTDGEDCVLLAILVHPSDLKTNAPLQRVGVNQTIDLEPELDAMNIEGAFLLDSAGKGLSKMRFGALLPAGGGRSAALPPGSLSFDFETGR